MSSAIFNALPAAANVFLYDEDGDAVMTDAQTGLPIGFAGNVRARSESVETERLEEGEVTPRRGSTGTLIASPLPGDGAAAVAPLAPTKASVGPRELDAEEDDSAVRNLATQMAEMVLDGEPRDDAPPPAGEPGAEAPPAGEQQSEGPPPDGFGTVETEEWCLGLRCSDLSLRLDMRHPRVLLNFFRFVECYNELAPYGEEIHVPLIPDAQVAFILNHESLVNPPPEFASEIVELRSLVQRYSCACADCYPKEDDDHYSTDSEDRRHSYRYNYYSD
jgi:hypothetical protein